MTDSIYTGEDFEDKVKKQVEFYFSDSNLQQDKFLWRIYEANDGWVELKTLLTFGRMRQYRPEEKVIAALKASDKLVLSANEDMVRRKDPIKDFNEVKNIKKRNSVHIEGFPSETTQEEVEEWFSEKIVPSLPKEQGVCSIRRIKNRATKEFFGVVDVEFKTLEDAEHFLGVSVSYPEGIVAENEVEGKQHILKKMSLLTFREMRESSKRFGVNEVTKRRNSFKDNNRKKPRKDDRDEKTEEAIEETEEKTDKTEKTEEAAAEAEKAPEAEAASETDKVEESAAVEA